jgi:hypothetical protein
VLNLTGKPIVLIPTSGDGIVIDPSDYIARVETVRHEVGHERLDDGFLENVWIGICQEIPSAIMVDHKGTTWPLDSSIVNGIEFTTYGDQGVGNDELLLVTEEVARAARDLHNPLADRMVWATDCTKMESAQDDLLAYGALQRCAQDST